MPKSLTLSPALRETSAGRVRTAAIVRFGGRGRSEITENGKKEGTEYGLHDSFRH